MSESPCKYIIPPASLELQRPTPIPSPMQVNHQIMPPPSETRGPANLKVTALALDAENLLVAGLSK